MIKVSIGEAARLLGVTEHTIRRRLRKGDLKGKRIPRPQGFIWEVHLDTNGQSQQTGTYATQVVVQEPQTAVQAPVSPNGHPPVQSVEEKATFSPGDALTRAQLAELNALRARVAVLEERAQAKDDLIAMLQDRLKVQDWQVGEVLNQLNEVQSRMLPPGPQLTVDSETEITSAQPEPAHPVVEDRKWWKFWK